MAKLHPTSYTDAPLQAVGERNPDDQQKKEYSRIVEYIVSIDVVYAYCTNV